MKNFYFLVCLSAMFLLGCTAEEYMPGGDTSPDFSPSNPGSPLNYSKSPNSSFGSDAIAYCTFSSDYYCKASGDTDMGYMSFSITLSNEPDCCLPVPQKVCSEYGGVSSFTSCSNAGSCVYADGRCEPNVLQGRCNGTYTHNGECDVKKYNYCVYHSQIYNESFCMPVDMEEYYTLGYKFACILMGSDFDFNFGDLGSYNSSHVNSFFATHQYCLNRRYTYE